MVEKKEEKPKKNEKNYINLTLYHILQKHKNKESDCDGCPGNAGCCD